MIATGYLNRRQLLQAGGISALGLTLPDLLRAEGRGGSRPRATSCILIYLFGGCSHIDTFDMKPDAPEGIRGEFDPVSTRVPGTQFCEHLPQVGQLADKFAVIRSMTHDQTLHTASVGFALSGVRPTVIGG